MRKPRDEWIAVPIPDPEIPPELVDAARERMGKNKAPSERHDRFWELSGGIVRCASCGYVMGSSSSGTPTNDYYYYRCRSKYNAKSNCENGRGVRADTLEAEVWEAVFSVLKRPAHLRAALEWVIESQSRTLASSPEKEISPCYELVQRAVIKRSRYQDQQAEGLMTRQELRAKLAELDGIVRAAEAQIDELSRWEARLCALKKGAEEFLERYVGLMPGKLKETSK